MKLNKRWPKSKLMRKLEDLLEVLRANKKPSLEMLNKGKTEQPKEKTPEFHKIAKDNDDK